ncbi:MAG: hypothetical protein NWR72_05050 [Bacteroidia bacterium]|nr:hypothetical protein [Bacteroidia bacterium]
MSYIYLESYRPGDSLAPQPWEGDMMRNRVLVRINLFHPGNAPLQSLAAPTPFDQLCPGLVGLILGELHTGRLLALHPANPRYQIGYGDFLSTLILWQGLGSMWENEQIAGQDLGLEWLQPGIDLIADKSFVRQNSREAFRIRYVRLIWNHPGLALGPRAVMLIPYDRLRPLLQSLSCEAGPQSPANISVAEFLEQRYFVGQPLRLPDDPVIVLPFGLHDAATMPDIDWNR